MTVVDLSAIAPHPEPRLNRRQLAKRRTLEKMKAAARALFADVGYFEVGIRDVAQRMGMSTGAVFAQVGSKAELWRVAMGGPAPSPELAQEVALIEAQLADWTWLVRKGRGEYLAALTPPNADPALIASGAGRLAAGPSPAAALRLARLAALANGNARAEAAR
ncbi:MAG: helix-turn-helix domain-containing protein [Brevundimonas sp.]